MRALLLVATLPLLALSPPAGVPVTGKVTFSEKAAPKILAIQYAGPDIHLRKDADPSPAVVWLEGVPDADVKPVTLEIRQEGLELRPRVAAVPVGSTVKFPNRDETQHNVFSQSPGNDFNLGKYPKGESCERTFKTKGRVDLRCDLHKFMFGYVHVFDHPYFAVTAPDGTFIFPDVPPGEYTLVAWKERFVNAVRKKIEVKAGAPPVEIQFTMIPASSEAPPSCCSAR